MSRAIVGTLALACALLGAGTLDGAEAQDVAGVLSPTPVGASTCMATQLTVAPGAELTGVRWFNNDGQEPPSEIRVVEGTLEEPGQVVATLEPNATLSSSWVTTSLPEPEVLQSTTLHVILTWPSYSVRTDRGPGTGCGIGHVEGFEGSSASAVSYDGVSWVLLPSSLQLAVELVTDGEVFLKAARTGEPAGVQDVGQSRVLRVFPNPGNPAFAVDFELARPEHVSIQVYDARGRLVRVVEDAQWSAGVHEAVWHGADSSGRAVSSGVYFLQVRLGETLEQRRVTLIR